MTPPDYHCALTTNIRQQNVRSVPPPAQFDLQAEILALLQTIVAQSGPDALSQLTRKMVRDRLEAKLGYSLAQYKDQIKYDLAAVLESHPELLQPVNAKRPNPRPDNPKPKRAKSNTGINAPLNISPTLASVLGSSDPISRPQIVKQLWAYIKAHQLQDPADGRFILCDPLLLKLFGSKRVSAFGMQKLLSNHLTKIEGPLPGTTVAEVAGVDDVDAE
ncbi:SWIB/MDM2 domain-containing protein [Catenaria anguillulae PL171]|uniref:SWIB/MDM2 domain-containing protein n=1 Tax=Catenaria anguillulae PL171 TaxID=765915 RepID=A0A1Y2HI46_9FUNG|nr:SWIB/MDM2 domain-containing protein [Catenaria anguillulae PL171]